MRVTFLIGSSGTGKSYQAMNLASQRDIRYIIDDGLLIKENKIIAGKSAKREASRLGAVRRALFMDRQHQQKVIESLEKEKPEAIMVLGTSRKMVDIISEQLSLGEPDHVLWLEDLVSREEIELAQKIRKQEGKHVIPVPALQLKKDFSGYFLNPIKALRSLGKESGSAEHYKSVVRPTFSYKGHYTISDGVIRSLVHYSFNQFSEVQPVGRTFVQNSATGLEIQLEVRVAYGVSIPKTLEKLQQSIIDEVEGMTSLHIDQVMIHVRKFQS
ncbi:Asp23 family, cell envelope-related function [Tindallia magadiensis]|uniref:Asp23 family, cell envelope-related function n=1 Tax=Tindallia magadiensis TaxID=69895 RepID=A0A1I3CBU5_9FIRM|nr:Asp23/Gls24 family envelope stress response protein [Tindallia magadiensis]SFH71659.1 Asp23 family, cell envelope-related function [Tindallia magadiensis]